MSSAAAVQYGRPTFTTSLGGSQGTGQGDSSPALAFTGFELAPLLITAVVLLVLGLAFLRSLQGDKRMTIRRVFRGIS